MLYQVYLTETKDKGIGVKIWPPGTLKEFSQKELGGTVAVFSFCVVLRCSLPHEAQSRVWVPASRADSLVDMVYVCWMSCGE